MAGRDQGTAAVPAGTREAAGRHKSDFGARGGGLKFEFSGSGEGVWEVEVH